MYYASLNNGEYLQKVTCHKRVVEILIISYFLKTLFKTISDLMACGDDVVTGP